MSYEFVSMEDAGTSTGDYIMRLRSIPSMLQRWFGAQEEIVTYYGQGTEWHPMFGLPVSPRTRKVLKQSWDQYQPPDAVACNGSR